MDATSLHTNIRQEEGSNTVCEAYEEFHQGNPPLPIRYVRELLSLILKENSFQFNEKYFLQSRGPAKLTQNQSFGKDLLMTSYHCGTQKETKLKNFSWRQTASILQSNSWLIYQKQRRLSWTLYSVQRRQILQRIYTWCANTFQCTNFHSCHPPDVTKGFIKGEALTYF